MPESRVADEETWTWYEAHTEKAIRDIIGNRMYEWLEREVEKEKEHETL